METVSGGTDPACHRIRRVPANGANNLVRSDAPCTRQTYGLASWPIYRCRPGNRSRLVPTVSLPLSDRPDTNISLNTVPAGQR